MRHQAIRNIYPNVIVIKDDIGCFDENNDIVEIDEILVLEETQRLSDEYNSTEYIRQRIKEYPYIGDLADAIYWQTKGDDSHMIAYIQACDEIKNKYPKPTGVE